MDFSADSDIFLLDSPHSVTVGADSAPVLYDEPFKMAEVYEGQIGSTAPACSMLDTDLVRLGIRQATQLTIFKNLIAVDDFEVAGIAPDGAGMTRLILTKDF